MTRKSNTARLPPIIVSEIEHEYLTSLAAKAGKSAPDAANLLDFEMERAVVVPADEVPSRVVRMGSTVEFSFDAGHPRQVTLVFPTNANISEGKISILTPIGAALIGLSEGQSISWKARDGRLHKLKVLRVELPMTTSGPAPGRQATVLAFSPRSRVVPGDGPRDPNGDDPGPRAA